VQKIFFILINHLVRFDERNQTGVSERVVEQAITLVTAIKRDLAYRTSTEATCKRASGLNRFPRSMQMTTRIPGPSARPTGGAPSLFEPQSKDDALLRTWFPNLDKKARDFFFAEWRQTGLPLTGNHEAAKKLYDQLFGGARPSKTRPRSLSATLTSESGRKPKPLRERAVHVPSAQAPAPVPEPYPEIYIDLTDFLASAATEAKAEEAPATSGSGLKPKSIRQRAVHVPSPSTSSDSGTDETKSSSSSTSSNSGTDETRAPLEAKSGILPEDEALCKELDKSLEERTPRFRTDRRARLRRVNASRGFEPTSAAELRRKWQGQRAVHVPSPSTSSKSDTDEAPALLEAKSGMRAEDEALCKELDKILEDWTQRSKTYKVSASRFATHGFREEFTAHCQKLRQIYKKCLKGAEDQRALLRARVSEHVSDFLSVAGQSENFLDLEVVATSAKKLLCCYPQAALRVDLGGHLAEAYRQLVSRPDGSRRRIDDKDLIPTLANAIVASDDSSGYALVTTAFQYCGNLEMNDLFRRIEEADRTRYARYKLMKCIENSIEQPAQTILNLSTRGSDEGAAQLFRIAVENASIFPLGQSRPTVAGSVLEAYQALSRRAKYLALQDRDLKRDLSQVLTALPGSEEPDAVLTEIKEFDPNLFALPEVSTGSDIVSIIKKLEEPFANLPDVLADNVGALLHSHIQTFLESAGRSGESLDERGARSEVLLGALNYAVTVKGDAIWSLACLLSAGEAGTVRSWFGERSRIGEKHPNPIAHSLDARLAALRARDEDY
jgi:hypothetical protein